MLLRLDLWLGAVDLAEDGRLVQVQLLPCHVPRVLGVDLFAAEMQILAN